MKQTKIKRQIAAALLCGSLLLSGCAKRAPFVDAAAELPELVTGAAETHAPSERAGVPETDAPESEPQERPEALEPDPPETTAASATTAAPETSPASETSPAPETAKGQKDTEPPFFLYLVSTVQLERGSSFELHDYLSYIDDLDADVELTVEGSVDPNQLGDYRLKLTLRDDAGNTAASSMTVRITEPTARPEDPGTAPAFTAKSFAAFASAYKKDGATVGIDVSRWQGEIDFNQVAAAGCEFVIIRIGGCLDGLFEDPYFKSNFRNAKAAGLKVGVYWASRENGPAQVREDAAYLYELLGGEALDYPIFFDWEDFTHFENYNMSMRDLNEMYLTFRTEAEARGYRAALYSSKFYLGVVWSEEVKGDGVWLAQYTEHTDYRGKFFLWQQGLGRIDGIDGDVDVDVCYPAAIP